MKKRFCTAFLVAFWLLLLTVPVSARRRMPRLVDDAGLLTDAQADRLLDQLDEISQRQKSDIVVVTKNSLDGKSPMEFADDFYDSNDYGYGAQKDGVLFLISMAERDWHISTAGFGITAVTDAGISYMSERFLGELSDGEYAKAFRIFADLCDDFLTQARENEPYDVGNLPKKPFPAVRNLAIALGAGLLLAFFAAEVMRGRLRTVRSQQTAGSYVKAGSFKLTRKSDLFLYRQITRVKKPEDHDGPKHSGGGSHTHTSSSGRTHGGGGGKF